MYNKQKAEMLREMYKEAQEKNLTGAEAEVSFLYPKNKFYFSVDGMEYTITIKKLANGLEDGGFEVANKIKNWAEVKYD